MTSETRTPPLSIGFDIAIELHDRLRDQFVMPPEARVWLAGRITGAVNAARLSSPTPDGVIKERGEGEVERALRDGLSQVEPASGLNPSDFDPSRILAIYEDHIARLQEEAGSWRRVAERVEGEKRVLLSNLDRYSNALRNARHAASGGNALRSTADMLRWLADHKAGLGPVGEPPSLSVARDRACMLDAAVGMMHGALSPAPGIETGTATTEGRGPKDESPVTEGEAPASTVQPPSSQESGVGEPGRDDWCYDMDLAPRDRTRVLLSLPSSFPHYPPHVGECYFNPDADGGTWWWSGTDAGDYYSTPLSETNAPPEAWRHLPPPAAPRPSQREG